MRKLALGATAFLIGLLLVLLLPASTRMIDPRAAASAADRRTIAPRLTGRASVPSDPEVSSWLMTYQGLFSREGWRYVYGWAMKPDGNGGVVVAGSAGLQPPFPSEFISDLMVLQMGPAGRLGWSLFYQGDENVQCYSSAWDLTPTSDGSFLVVGDVGFTSALDHEAAVFKIQPPSQPDLPPQTGTHHSGYSPISASVQWAKAFRLNAKGVGAEKWDQATAAVQTSDGGFLVGGRGASGYWLIKLDPAGNVLWHEGLGPNRSALKPRLVAAPDGGGLVFSLDDPNVLLKIGPDGREEWRRSLTRKREAGEPEFQVIIWSCVADPIGGYIVSGNTHYYCGGHSCFAGSFICGLDGEGHVLWQAAFSDFRAEFVCRADDGGFLVHDTESTMVKFDASGKLQWKRGIGSPDSLSYLVSAVPARDGGWFVLYGDLFYDADSENSRIGLARLDSEGRLGDSTPCPYFRDDATATQTNMTILSEWEPGWKPTANSYESRPLAYVPYSRPYSSARLCAGPDKASEKMGRRDTRKK